MEKLMVGGTRLIIIALVVAAVSACGSCGSPSEHYQNGLAAQQAGDPEKALKEFEAAEDYGDAKQQVAALQQTPLGTLGRFFRIHPQKGDSQ